MHESKLVAEEKKKGHQTYYMYMTQNQYKQVDKQVDKHVDTKLNRTPGCSVNTCYLNIYNHLLFKGDNPVFTVGVDVLNEEMKKIEEDDPVAAFLMSDEFKSVASFEVTTY